MERDAVIAGFGFRASASIDSLASALARTGIEGVTALAAPQDKCDALVLRALAARLGLPVVPVSPEVLRVQTTHTNAPRSQAARGTGSVAEAAALAVAGPNARLVKVRAISEDRLATCAIAEEIQP
jgi:cobalt-precorrin 5A hydrolase